VPQLTPLIVINERQQLMKRNKESLKKDARELNVKVNCRVNGSSCDAPKELIVSRLLEKRIFAMYPTLAAEAGNDESHASRIGINDKFRLINVIFF
jgi:hypothetical protein